MLQVLLERTGQFNEGYAIASSNGQFADVEVVIDVCPTGAFPVL